MKTRLQVIKCEEISGTGQKGPYKFCKLHCVIFSDKEGEDPIIGLLIPPKGMDDVSKGYYDAEFGLGVDRENRIIGVLKTLTPVKVAAPAAKAAF